MKEDIVKRLEIKAGIMEMGEKIAWGSDTALMREAAAEIIKLRLEEDGAKEAFSVISQEKIDAKNECERLRKLLALFNEEFR